MKKDMNKFLVEPQQKLKEVIQVIDANGQGIALVIDNDKTFLGLVTDGDIRRAIIKGISLDCEINDIMNGQPTTVKEGFNFNDIVEILSNKPIDHLPILSENNKVLDLLLRREVSGLLKHSSSLFDQKVNNSTLKKILVVGGGGYVGSVLSKQLLDRGYSVKVLDKLIFGDSSLSELKNNENFSYVVNDIGNVETIIEAIKDVDAVVQLAEIVGDPACAINPQKTQQTNFICTTLIANICRYFQINRFIYASSCSVYGASKKDQLLTENSPLNPVSLYARMKIEAEKAILGLSDGIFSPTILRFATVFGLSPRMRFDLVVNILAAKAVREGKITIFGGDQWRPLVHVKDIAEAILKTLEAPIETVRGEVFNVGSSENNHTINGIGKIINENVPSAEVVLEEKDVDKRNYKVDFSKINTVLGFKAKFTVADGVKEIMEALNKGHYENYQAAEYSNQKTFSADYDAEQLE